MPEQEPQYFKEFRKHFDKKIDDAVERLAISTKKQFDFMDEKMATKNDINEILITMATKDDIKQIRSTMATKDDIARLEGKIDGLENKFDRLEGIVLDDHRPRIKKLEKLVLRMAA